MGYQAKKLNRETNKNCICSTISMSNRAQILAYTHFQSGRHGGLMVSALDSGFGGGPGSTPGRGTALCS